MIRNKYGAKKTTVDGITFASKKEALRYSELKILEKAGQISRLEWQIQYVLAPAVRIGGRMRPSLRYYADFRYRTHDGQTVIEDVKGGSVRTEGYRIKRHLMAALGHTITEI